jgi:hypothetical protein
MRVKLDVSLSGGALYTLNTLEFVFFDLTLRTPLMGTSKGKSLIQIKGLNLRALKTEDRAYEDALGIRRIAKGVLPNTVCEFGSPPGSQSMFAMVSVGASPSSAPWPQFSVASCKQEQVGTVRDEVCAISCLSPMIPNEPCVPGSTAACRFFVEEASQCPLSSSGSDPLQYCVQLVPKFAKFGIAINFEGQRIILPGGWAYEGGEAPVVNGAKFLDDLSGMVIEFDSRTNKAGSLTQTASLQLFIDGLAMFGRGSYSTWSMADRLLVYFGPSPLVTEDTYVQFRPFLVALGTDKYKFVVGSFPLVPVEDPLKARPVVKIDAPQDASSCTGMFACIKAHREYVCVLCVIVRHSHRAFSCDACMMHRC